MLDVETFSRVVSQIHATATSPHTWQQTLSDTAQHLGARACTLTTGAGRERQIYSTSIDPEASAAYASYYHRMDFVAATCEKNPIGLVASGWGLVKANKNTEFHVDWQRRFGMTDGFQVRLSDNPPSSLFISAPPSDKPFETAERTRFVDGLVPHIQRALAARHQILGGATDHAVGDATAELIRHAVFTLGRGGRVVRMNSAAESLALVPDGLYVHADRVRASTPTVDTLLQASIVGALPGRDGAPRVAGFLTCERPSGKRSYIVRVVPLDTDDDPRHARVAVVVINLDQDVVPSKQLLQTLFGFTATEYTVAIRLLAGDELKAISADLSVTLATVKTHVQRIFSKTGTHRQVELVRLLFAIAS